MRYEEEGGWRSAKMGREEGGEDKRGAEKGKEQKDEEWRIKGAWWKEEMGGGGVSQGGGREREKLKQGGRRKKGGGKEGQMEGWMEGKESVSVEGERWYSAKILRSGEKRGE